MLQGRLPRLTSPPPAPFTNYWIYGSVAAFLMNLIAVVLVYPISGSPYFGLSGLSLLPTWLSVIRSMRRIVVRLISCAGPGARVRPGQVNRPSPAANSEGPTQGCLTKFYLTKSWNRSRSFLLVTSPYY